MKKTASSKTDLLFPSQEERIKHLIWLAFLRVVITTFIAGSLFLIILPSPSPMLYILIAANILANLLSAFFFSRGKNLRPWTIFSISWDLIFITALLALSGGAHSPYSFLYFLSLIYSGIILSSKGTIFTAAFCFLLHGVVLSAHAAGFLPLPFLLEEPESAYYPTTSSKEAFSIILSRGIGFFIAAISSNLIAEQIRKTTFRLQQKEKELAHYKARFDDIVKSIQIGLLTLDEKGYVTYINPTGEKILGDKLRELVNKPLKEVLPEFSEDKIRELEYNRPDGTKIFLRKIIQPLKDSDGNEAGSVISFSDFTELKKMQDEFLRAEKLVALGRLTASIAHEIRNPLAAISGCVELLKTEIQPSATAQRCMNIVLEETNRLNRLVSDLLDFTRPMKTVETTVDLTKLLEDLAYAASTNPDCRDRIEIETEIAKNLTLKGDPAQLKQMFWNIIINAVEAINGKGKITIKAEEIKDKEGNILAIIISDTGSGISPDIIGSIFDPFFTTKEKGTGLGLTIAHKIAQSHGGRIMVESAVGKGTEFTITIPIQEATKAED